MRWEHVASIAAFLVFLFALFKVVQLLDKWLGSVVARKAVKHPRSLESFRNGVITVSEHGFSVRRGKAAPANVRWEDITEKVDCKVDELVVDCVCLGFTSGSDGNFT